MRMYLIGLYLVLGLIPFTLNAQQNYTLINGIKVEAVGVTSARVTSSGEVLQGIQFRAQSGTTAPKYYDRAVQFTKGSTGKSIKGFFKNNAFQLGVTATLLGVGWVLDDITKDVYTSPGTPATPLGSSIWRCSGGCPVGFVDTNWYPSSSALAEAFYGLQVVSGSSWRYGHSMTNLGSYGSGAPNYTYNAYFQCGTSPPYAQDSCQVSIQNNTGVTNPTSYPNGSPSVPPTIATDTQVAERVVPNIAPSNLPKLHTSPSTGAVQDTQEVLDKKTQVANEYAKELNPSSVDAPAPVASTSPSPETTNPNPAATDAPAFCLYASVVCEWLDWTADTGEMPQDANYKFQDSITTLEPEAVNYSSGLGNGSCPSPETFTVLGTSLEYSYEPICDLAEIARIFVLLFAYMSSVYIVMGVRK